MLQRKQTRYYLSALLILIVILLFPGRAYGAYMDKSLSASYSEWPGLCFFLIALTSLLLLLTITRRKKKPQLVLAMIASVVYGVMLMTAIVMLYFDRSYAFDTWKKTVPKPGFMPVWLGITFAGWILLMLGNKALIKEIKLLDPQDRLR